MGEAIPCLTLKCHHRNHVLDIMTLGQTKTKNPKDESFSRSASSSGWNPDSWRDDSAIGKCNERNASSAYWSFIAQSCGLVCGGGLLAARAHPPRSTHARCWSCGARPTARAMFSVGGTAATRRRASHGVLLWAAGGGGARRVCLCVGAHTRVVAA